MTEIIEELKATAVKLQQQIEALEKPKKWEPKGGAAYHAVYHPSTASWAYANAELELSNYLKEQQDNAGIRKPREDGLSPELGCYIESMLSVKG